MLRPKGSGRKFGCGVGHNAMTAYEDAYIGLRDNDMRYKTSMTENA